MDPKIVQLNTPSHIPTIGAQAPKCVFQAQTSKGRYCVVAKNLAEAAVLLHEKGFEVGMIQAVGELVE